MKTPIKNFTRMIQSICLVALCSQVQISQANLVVHITQGVNKPFPILFSPMGGSDSANQFEKIIENDLVQTGQFKIMSPNGVFNQVISVNQFPWSAWPSAGIQADYAVIGQVQSDGSGNGNSWNVSFQVFNIYGKYPLAGKVYSHISDSSMRLLAHQIANQIYQAITGVPGDFDSRIAYVLVNNPTARNATYRLVVSDRDGSNPQILLRQSGNPISSPTWSHDGKNIAYTSYIHNRMAIYSIELATGQRTLIANFPGINSSPAYSPDGSVMAMALSMGQGVETNIYLVNLNTRRYQKLTHAGTNTEPSFSPDGRSIVFTSDRGGTPQVYKIDLSSGSTTRLSYDGVQNFRPEFTPDGRSVILMHQEYTAGPIRIAVLDLASGTIQEITSGNLDKSPSLSPNGKMVIYANYDQPRGILAEASINGQVHLTLPATEGWVQSPAWS